MLQDAMRGAASGSRSGMKNNIANPLTTERQRPLRLTRVWKNNAPDSRLAERTLSPGVIDEGPRRALPGGMAEQGAPAGSVTAR